MNENSWCAEAFVEGAFVAEVGKGNHQQIKIPVSLRVEPFVKEIRLHEWAGNLDVVVVGLNAD